MKKSLSCHYRLHLFLTLCLSLFCWPIHAKAAITDSPRPGGCSGTRELDYQEFVRMSFTVMTGHNAFLKSFADKLFSDSPEGKKDIVKYLMYNYPIIIFDSLMVHHHHVVELRPGKKKDLGRYRFADDRGDARAYRMNFIDYQEIEYEAYDNIRYAWWNPYIENFRDPMHFPGIQESYLSRASLKESGLVLAINYFKATLVRSAEGITQWYRLFKEPLFSTLTVELYRRLKINVTVDTLLEAYTFYKKGDEAGFVDLLGKRTYGDWEPAGTRPINRLFVLASSNFRWYYSFWTRRECEGNSDAVRAILEEIQKHYASSSKKR